MRRRRKRRSLLFLLCGVVFLISACKVCSILSQSRKERLAFERLEEIAQAAEGEGRKTVGGAVAALKKQNPDCFGWLSIEGTELQYPVMFTPEEPEYYLYRNFEGEQSPGGVPFLAEGCYAGCGNYLIYGHNMKNATMFASLLSYAEREYWEEHPVIQFDTLEDSGEYEIVAAFYGEAYPKAAEGVFRYYEYTDLTDAAVFQEYMEQVQRAALYDTGVSAAFGDPILTLSTCSYHKEEGRFVVVARKAETA